MQCIGNRASNLAEIITDSNVDETSRTPKMGKMLYVAANEKFLDGLCIILGPFVAQEQKQENGQCQ